MDSYFLVDINGRKPLRFCFVSATPIYLNFKLLSPRKICNQKHALKINS